MTWRQHRSEAFAIAQKLIPILDIEREQGLDAAAPKVIEALGGDSASFWALDENPGYYGGYERGTGYAGLLRRVRNSPTWGPKMFASFKT